MKHKGILLISSIGIVVLSFMGISQRAQAVGGVSGFVQELGESVVKGIQEGTEGALEKEALIEQYKGYADQLTTIFKQSAIASIKSDINSRNPFKDVKHVRVESGHEKPGLSQREKEYRAARAPFVKKGLEKFFGQPLNNKQINIAFAGSGGGYRAMILTLGYLLGLENLGLYDAFLASTSLSGSTWLQAPAVTWKRAADVVAKVSAEKFPTTIKKTYLEQYKDFLLNKIRDNKFDLVGMKRDLIQNGLVSFVNDVIWPKFVFNMPISSIDIFGALLGRIFFGNFPGVKDNDYFPAGALRQMLPAQWEMIQDGSVPFPIYTSVSIHKSDTGEAIYNWYEFNPIDIRNLDLNYFFPSYAFGWEFDKGLSVDSAPVASLAYLMGIWGSAYSVNIADLSQILPNELQQIKGRVEKIKADATIFILELLSKENVGKLRVSPAQINNPFKNMDSEKVGTWLSERENLVFVDGGIRYNIPLRPLFRPERNIQVIVIGESSGSLPSTSELKKALDDARRVYGYNYTRVDDRSTEIIQLYKDINNPKAPRIIYITFLNDIAWMNEISKKNPRAAELMAQYNLKDFDAAKCLATGFCGTFNLGKHSEPEFLQLLNMAFFNVLAGHEIMKAFLEKEFNITPAKETPAQEEAQEEAYWFGF